MDLAADQIEEKFRRSRIVFEIRHHQVGSILKFKAVDWTKLSWIVAIEVGLIMVAATLFLAGGQDIRQYYEPFARGCLECGFVPYYVQPLLSPMLLFSGKFIWTFWSLLSIAGLLLLAKKTEINPLVFMLSFPMLVQFWLGQIDILICLGVFLALFHRNGIMRGLCIFLMLAKPQIAILAVIYLLFREDHKELWKVLIVPAAAFGISLVVYGFRWPLEWLLHAQANIPDHQWNFESDLLWPWEIVLFPLPFALKDKKDGTMVSFLISALLMPFFSLYSYIVFLLFESPYWLLPLTIVYYLGYSKFGEIEILKLVWVLPMLYIYLDRRFNLKQTILKMLRRTP